MNFFTSDTHFNHVNIIGYSSRPFKDVAHMTEGLVENWNSVVSPSDTVYHLGDFGMGDKSQIPVVRKRLNGRIILVRGNHDCKHNGKLLPFVESGGFEEIHTELTTTVDGMKVFMRHEPKMDFVPDENAALHLCGHVHESWNRVGSIINVGVDVNDYRPVTLDQLVSMVEKKGKSHRGY